MSKKFRTKLLIYRPFQLSLLGANLVMLIIVYSIIRGALWKVFHSIKQMGLQSGFTENHPFFRFIGGQEHEVLKYLHISLSVGAIIFCILTLILSHRVAGPIVRLRRYFEDLHKNGIESWRPLSFRKGDFFSDLPQSINQTLKPLKEQTDLEKI